jgi:hypothetical protein
VPRASKRAVCKDERAAKGGIRNRIKNPKKIKPSTNLIPVSKAEPTPIENGKKSNEQ